MNPQILQVLKPLKTKTRKVSIAPAEFLTTQELMRLLKIRHKQTIYRLIDNGLPAIIVGKNFRFIKNEVINFLKRHFKGRGIKHNNKRNGRRR